MAVTRRVVWLDDAQWDALCNKALSADMSVSQLIRFALLDDDGAEAEAKSWNARHKGRMGDDTETGGTRSTELGSSEGRPMSQAERDAILRRVNKG